MGRYICRGNLAFSFVPKRIINLVNYWTIPRRTKNTYELIEFKNKIIKCTSEGKKNYNNKYVPEKKKNKTQSHSSSFRSSSTYTVLESRCTMSPTL